MRLSIEELGQSPVYARRFEVVECKGIGHPDTLCDSLVEAAATGLAAMYERELGFVAHFNLDKALLAAGQCQKEFGAGQLERPMRLYLGDRATFSTNGRELPVLDAVRGAVAAWLEANLRFVRLDRELVLEPVLAAGSAPLRGIYGPAIAETISNDTSGAVGFAPLSPTEEIVLRVRQLLNGSDFLRRFPEAGEDVKIFAVRNGTRLSLTIAMPFLCTAIDSEARYFQRKEEVLHFLAREVRHPELEIDWTLNSLDRRGHGASGVYLSLLGTSAEDADSGQVGRGNRACGFIAFARPVGGEAAAGKNPLAHVGKIYSVFSQYLAQRLHDAFPQILEVYVTLATRIGEPVRSPWVGIQLVLPSGLSLPEVAPAVERQASEEVARLPEFSARLIRGELPVV